MARRGFGWAARARRGVPAVLAACAALLTACQYPAGAGASPATAAARSASPSGHGAVFLGVGECSSFGTAGVTEVPCDGERAAARVAARYDGAVAGGPPCPPYTDFVLHIDAHRPAADEDGDGAVPQGYACMRNLQPPHPGDPGQGGGPRTVVGDCVRDAGRGRVRETPCAGTGGRAPRYRVTAAVADRADCPASTTLYVRLGGSRPVGCARPMPARAGRARADR
ncbi:hypothetical protein [Streptomyces echinoruber]|uniref:hypothetical protein n=1 Tax=Streptomyces echinoruber TaxID=68898 RepID=UPI00167E2927|nr:hypothetical protein [Streptomyces echinoruber]